MRVAKHVGRSSRGGSGKDRDDSPNDIITPVVTCGDMIKLLTKLKKQALGNDTDLNIVFKEDDMIVTNVAWNQWGDAVEIHLKKGS